MKELHARLAAFQQQHKITSKGKLAAILFVSREAKKKKFPLDAEILVTDGRGQVLGLGKAAVQAILKDYGINRVLAEEGGRTSRGSMGKMQEYVAFLNALHKAGLANTEAIEVYWVSWKDSS